MLVLLKPLPERPTCRDCLFHGPAVGTTCPARTRNLEEDHAWLSTHRNPSTLLSSRWGQPLILTPGPHVTMRTPWRRRRIRPGRSLFQGAGVSLWWRTRACCAGHWSASSGYWASKPPVWRAPRNSWRPSRSVHPMSYSSTGILGARREPASWSFSGHVGYQPSSSQVIPKGSVSPGFPSWGNPWTSSFSERNYARCSQVHGDLLWKPDPPQRNRERDRWDFPTVSRSHEIPLEPVVSVSPGPVLQDHRALPRPGSPRSSLPGGEVYSTGKHPASGLPQGRFRSRCIVKGHAP